MVLRSRELAALAIVAVAALSSSASVASAGSEPSAPSVRVAEWHPLVVVGRNFRPFERIVIRVLDPGSPTIVKRVRATRRGAFVATVATSVDRCNGPSVVVTRADGRIAKARMPLPLCPPGIP